METPEPYDWEAHGYRDCSHCHGGFPLEQMMGDVCRWCERTLGLKGESEDR